MLLKIVFSEMVGSIGANVIAVVDVADFETVNLRHNKNMN